MVGRLEEGAVVWADANDGRWAMFPTKNPKTANTPVAEGRRNETGTDCFTDDTVTAR
jgi:hypothetical protein